MFDGSNDEDGISPYQASSASGLSVSPPTLLLEVYERLPPVLTSAGRSNELH